MAAAITGAATGMAATLLTIRTFMYPIRMQFRADGDMAVIPGNTAAIHTMDRTDTPALRGPIVTTIVRMPVTTRCLSHTISPSIIRTGRTQRTILNIRRTIRTRKITRNTSRTTKITRERAPTTPDRIDGRNPRVRIGPTIHLAATAAAIAVRILSAPGAAEPSRQEIRREPASAVVTASGAAAVALAVAAADSGDARSCRLRSR